MTVLRWGLPSSVIVETLEDGTVYYNTATDKVTCLTGPATEVLAAATDATVAEISARTGLADDIVAAYLTELGDQGLVAASEADPRLARRTLVATAAGAAVTLGVWAVVAPTPAAADSYVYYG